MGSHFHRTNYTASNGGGESMNGPTAILGLAIGIAFVIFFEYFLGGKKK